MINGIQMRKPIAILATMLSGLVVAGCNIKSPDFVPELLELKVCPEVAGACPSFDNCDAQTQILPLGRDQQLCAIGLYSGVSSPDDGLLIAAQPRILTDEVLWRVEPLSQDVLSVDASGLATALKPSVSLVTAVASIDGLDAGIQFDVTDPVLESVTVEGIGNIGDVQPNGSVVVLEGTSRSFRCVATYSGDKGCQNGAACDVTDTATWGTSDSAVHSIDNFTNKGEGLALAEGQAEISCEFETLVADPGIIVRVCSATDAALTVDPTQISGLAVGGSRQLTMTASYTNCVTNSPAVVDVTADTVWETLDAGIADVDASGRVTGVAPGLTTVRGTFGSLESVDVSVAVVDVTDEFRLELTGPQFLIAGVDRFPSYELNVYRVDAATGSELPAEDVTDDSSTVWRSSAPAVMKFPNQAGIDQGAAEVVANPETQAIDVIANYNGVDQTLSVEIVAGTSERVEVRRDLVCSGAGILNLGLGVTYPVQLVSYAIIKPIDGAGQPLLTGTGDEQLCSVNVTQVATWTVAEGPDPFGGLVASCTYDAEAAPVTNSPVTVSDIPPSKGQVNPTSAIVPVPGTACVQAGFDGLGGASSFYVVTDLFDVLSCDGNAETAPSVGACSDLLAP